MKKKTNKSYLRLSTIIISGMVIPVVISCTNSGDTKQLTIDTIKNEDIKTVLTKKIDIKKLASENTNFIKLNLGLFIIDLKLSANDNKGILSYEVLSITDSKTDAKKEGEAVTSLKGEISGFKVAQTTGTEEKGIFSLPVNDFLAPDTYGLDNYSNTKATLTESLNKQEYNIRRNTGKPFAPHFHSSDVATWDATKEVDGNFVRSNVPLAPRKVALETNKINPNTLTNRVYFMDPIRKSTSKDSVTTVQQTGNSVESAYILGAMQYVTDWIYFGGSAGEGNLYIPRSQDIDAFHRAGVRVHATFFTDSGNGGGQYDMSELMGSEADFIQNAQKLVDMAKFYNFDGWFFNIESTTPPKWVDFMKQLKKIASQNNIEISYYKNSSSGAVFNAGKEAYDIWFNEYNHSIKVAPGIEAKFSPVGVLPQASSDVGMAINKHKGASIWFFFAWKDLYLDYTQQKMMELLNSGSTDPRDASTFGLSHWYKPYTTLIESKSFATSFNTGVGKNFFVDGVKINSPYLINGYRNLSLRDLQPTWMFHIDQLDNTGQIDNSNVATNMGSHFKKGLNVDMGPNAKAWFGSNAISYSGKIKANSGLTNKLFASEITLKDQDTFSMMFNNSEDANVNPSLSITTKNADSTFAHHIINGQVVSERYNNDYQKITFDVSSLKGKVMSSFGVALQNKTTNEIDLKNLVIGELAFQASGEQEISKVNIKQFTNEGEWFAADHKNIRLSWDNPDNNTHMYLVYKTNNKYENIELINITHTNAIFLENIPFIQEKYHLKIVPISLTNQVLEPLKVNLESQKVDFSMANKWKYKSFEMEEHSIKTNNQIITSIPDGNGGVYFVDEKIGINHLLSSGKVINSTDFGGQIFLGRENNKNGDAFAAIGTSKSKIIVTRKGTKNGIYVFDKQMQPLSNFDKFKDLSTLATQLFSTTDQYVSSIKILENETIILISQKGEVTILDQDGKMLKQETLIANGNNIKTTFLNNAKTNEVIVVLQEAGVRAPTLKKFSNNLFSVVDNSSFGTIDEILLSKNMSSTTKILTKDNKVMTFDHATEKVLFNQSIKLNKDYAKDINYDIAFSADGLKIILRDTSKTSNTTNSLPQYAQDMAHLIILDLKDPLNIEETKLPLKNATTPKLDGSLNKWAGKFQSFEALDNNRFWFATKDYGYIGVINFNEVAKEASLKPINEVHYSYQLDTKRELNMGTEWYLINDKIPPVLETTKAEGMAEDIINDFDPATKLSFLGAQGEATLDISNIKIDNTKVKYEFKKNNTFSWEDIDSTKNKLEVGNKIRVTWTATTGYTFKEGKEKSHIYTITSLPYLVSIDTTAHAPSFSLDANNKIKMSVVKVLDTNTTYKIEFQAANHTNAWSSLSNFATKDDFVVGDKIKIIWEVKKGFIFANNQTSFSHVYTITDDVKTTIPDFNIPSKLTLTGVSGAVNTSYIPVPNTIIKIEHWYDDFSGSPYWKDITSSTNAWEIYDWEELKVTYDAQGSYKFTNGTKQLVKKYNIIWDNGFLELVEMNS